MKTGNSDEFAKGVGYTVIVMAVLSLFFFTLYTFWYLYILAGGVFVGWVLWQVAIKENKNQSEKIKTAMLGFLFGAGGVALLIGLLYGSKAPWA